MIIKNGIGIHISKNIKYRGKLTIGHCSIIGDYNDRNLVTIGEDIIIGAFCKIEGGSIVGNNCKINDYSAIYKGAKIGNNIRLLPGSKVYANAIIGDDSIINGAVSVGVIIEENVRFFGRIAHSHRNHTLNWSTTREESPVFKKGSLIGLNSIIVGPVIIGSNSYVAAGEIVRCDIPDETVFYKGKIYAKERFRSLII